MPPDSTRDPEWTLATAATWFTESGIPTSEDQLAGIIALLPGFRPSGRAPSGPRGGVGKSTYRMSELMRLHARLTDWLVPLTGEAPLRSPRPAAGGSYGGLARAEDGCLRCPPGYRKRRAARRAG